MSASTIDPLDPTPEELRADLIDVVEAAELFSVNQATIRQWIRSGAVPHTRMPNGRIKLSRAWCAHRISEMSREASNG